MSDVCLIKAENDPGEYPKIVEKVKKVFSGYFDSGFNLAFKLHFGERKSTTHLKPDLVEFFYNWINSEVSESVLMDCNVLYKSDRSFGSSHKQLAEDNGFDFAPIEIGDGEKGEDELIVDLDQKHFDQARIGGRLADYDLLLVISHFTGHGANGIGGALKNVGMGLGSKSGKLRMHEAFELEVDPDDCRACGECIKECPAEAIRLSEGKAKINSEECIGCGRCIAACPINAIQIPWDAGSARGLQERIDEYAKAVLKDRKSLFVTVLFDITEECDCINQKQEPMVDDIGVLVSDDIVAIDQVQLDLVGLDHFSEDIDPEIQIKYAEELGLGESIYRLKRI